MKTENPLLARLRSHISGAIARGEGQAVTEMPVIYRKVRFTSVRHGSTAGLVVEAAKLARMSLADVSRLFPYSEANKMRRLEVSPDCTGWDAAFSYVFPSA